jgi:dimeric dUTPase (all-alpha-NTP-PPase superfamily)
LALKEGFWSMRIDLSNLLKIQKDLDSVINLNHNTTYETTSKERYLALLVELSELANATRTFKYWSNKGSESKERIIDEYVDALHFLLSLTLCFEYTLPIFEVNDEFKDVTTTEAFLLTYNEFNKFYLDKTNENLVSAFKTYLMLALKLNLTKEDIINGYLTKVNVNYNRQKEGY